MAVNVSVADDDSDYETTVPVITGLRIHSENAVETETLDIFKRPIKDSNDFDGLSPGFKKSTTAKMTKMRRGVDGTTSSRIDEKHEFDGYDMFGVVEPPHNLDGLAKLYEISPHHYAAVNAKVANVVGLGYILTESIKTKRMIEDISTADTDSIKSEKERTRVEAEAKKKLKRTRQKLTRHREDTIEAIESFNEDLTFTEILTRIWKDYETMGNGYLEIGRRANGDIGYLGHIPAQTIRIRRDRDGFVQVSGFKAQFFANFGAVKPSPFNSEEDVNEVIHFSKYSPTSGYYGIPDIIAAAAAVAGNEFATRYNLDYFEHKAVPRHIITLKGAKLGHTAESELLSFFDTIKGKNHRTMYIPLPPDSSDNKVELKIEPVESGIQDSSFTNYRKANLSDILMTHRVPITKISTGEGASLAVAKDADKTFKEQVCAPEQKNLEKKLNKVITELTDAYILKLNEMSLTDENTQSQIEERRRKTGVETANEQRNRRGEPSIEGGDELYDMNGSAKKNQVESPTVNRQRDSDRSSNATDSAGEARNPKGEGRTQS